MDSDDSSFPSQPPPKHFSLPPKPRTSPIGLIIGLPLAAFIRETLLYTYHQLVRPATHDPDDAVPALDQRERAGAAPAAGKG